jgi:hypothetical protein
MLAGVVAQRHRFSRSDVDVSGTLEEPLDVLEFRLHGLLAHTHPVQREDGPDRYSDWKESNSGEHHDDKDFWYANTHCNPPATLVKSHCRAGWKLSQMLSRIVYVVTVQ